MKEHLLVVTCQMAQPSDPYPWMPGPIFDSSQYTIFGERERFCANPFSAYLFALSFYFRHLDI